MTPPLQACPTCAHLVTSEAGAFVCTSTGAALTRWRERWKAQGKMPETWAPDCPGWAQKS